ncbi:MAG: Spy/CpxP family protein refolding chaperone [Bacteroidaceae bacterium]|nr:Spy/CpxP family protein refolding chaperone [Bacteroidaceae bacterium]
MRKSIFLVAFAALTLGNAIDANAQNNNGRDNRRQEMQARMTEQLIKDLKLTDEQKAKFEPIYANYQKELAELRQNQNREQAEERNKKELTEAEATAKLQEVFTRQEQQIQQQQQRLDIQKKYCAELSGVLTPQQLLKVFQPQQNRTRQGGQQGPRGGGGFGGPRGGGFGGGGFGGPGGGNF